MSARTSNNMEVIERMEFYKFNLLMQQLNIYIQEENKAQNGDGKGGEQETAADTMKGHMSSAKSMMSSVKLPSLKK